MTALRADREEYENSVRACFPISNRRGNETRFSFAPQCQPNRWGHASTCRTAHVDPLLNGKTDRSPLPQLARRAGFTLKIELLRVSGQIRKMGDIGAPLARGVSVDVPDNSAD